MTPTQQKYSIYDQELLALISALDKWRHLLRSAKVTVYTDHQALTFLQRLSSQKPLRGRTARWLDFLAEFSDLTITYLQGAKNKVADALSRHPRHGSGEPNRVQNLLASMVQRQGTPAAQPHYSTRLVTGSVPHPDFRAMIGRRLPTRQQRKSGSESQQAAGSAGTNESHQPTISAGAKESHLGAGSVDANESQQATGSGDYGRSSYDS
ncbi:uncharacterized protein EMH_0100210 [Eimeria mitis]|uniref:Reverse transcriptase RNase H-like domain-containing protein n=1 Tax=Eimeria mitis TaxID=44415 RepID=U6KJT8_9EIME|nr:uncharacterized protein EMH_0100210 [Eimeria mitis]CDJ35718.1 hypothetical protein EMH_0100210 [Eimeria mitis]